MKFSPDRLGAVLDRYPGRSLCVAFSGGLDSTVLLHALATLRNERDLKLRAIHVDHGLHADSPRWAEHCIAQAAALDVSCTVIRVAIEAGTGDGLEAVAREARYAAFVAEIGSGEALLTAQHADDQAETVLLALLRGSGPAGLAAMPEMTPFGAGILCRPLLGFPRAALHAWALEQCPPWIEDPSNLDRARARNYLRHAVLPPLIEYWPAAAQSLARSASLAAEADALLATLAALDLEALADGDTLDAEGVAALGTVRARNLLRHWLATLGLPVPPYERLIEAERQVREAAGDRVPEVEWPGAVLRRWGGQLFAEVPSPPVPTDWSVEWNGNDVLQLPENIGVIELAPATPGLSAARIARNSLRVAFRQGGEQLRVQALGPHRVVKHLLAEAGVPPWQRDRVPLVFLGEALIAVGDLYIDADWAAAEGEPALQVVWKR